MQYIKELQIIQDCMDKMRAIPHRFWCTNIQHGPASTHCFIGHYSPDGIKNVCDTPVPAISGLHYSPELKAVSRVILTYMENYLPPIIRMRAKKWPVELPVCINNKKFMQFTQDHPKDRIIALLEFVKERILIENPPITETIRKILWENSKTSVTQQPLLERNAVK